MRPLFSSDKVYMRFVLQLFMGLLDPTLGTLSTIRMPAWFSTAFHLVIVEEIRSTRKDVAQSACSSVHGCHLEGVPFPNLGNDLKAVAQALSWSVCPERERLPHYAAVQNIVMLMYR